MNPSCVSPPELQDAQLLRFLDGEADEQVGSHLEVCEHCREKADGLHDLLTRLSGPLYRFDCPPSMDLGEYLTHDLPRAQSKAMARHLSGCPHCTREIEIMRESRVALVAVPEFGPIDAVRVRIAKLLTSHGPGVRQALAPALPGIRGAEDASYAYYGAEDVRVAVETMQDAERVDRKALIGLVDGPEFDGMKVHLWLDQNAVATAALDEAGHFQFNGLAPGQYELILSGAQVEIHIQAVEV